MTQENRPAFISKDGLEFESEIDCKEHELAELLESAETSYVRHVPYTARVMLARKILEHYEITPRQNNPKPDQSQDELIDGAAKVILALGYVREAIALGRVIKACIEEQEQKERQA